MRKTNAILVILMMSLLSLSGCFGEEEVTIVEETSEFFDFEDMLDGRTWYHYPGGMNAMNNTTALGGENIPFNSSSISPPFKAIIPFSIPCDEYLLNRPFDQSIKVGSLATALVTKKS